MGKASGGENIISDNVTENIRRLRAGEKREPIASFLNLRLLELSPGYSKVAMKLTADYENSFGFIFGGIVMAVADQAFGYAANSLISPNIASQFNIHFIAASRIGDELIAECRVVKSGRRVGIS
ncbi:MAG: PaaI family thioesterase, partial [Dehalococcoidales bacterium]|nr:PaaI family thioesterase [Dehalococcoidales bacterium]